MDGVVTETTTRLHDQTFGGAENMIALAPSPEADVDLDSSGIITLRDARQVDADTVSAFVHVPGYEDSDPDPGRVYFGIFQKEGDTWKIDFLRPEFVIADVTFPDASDSVFRVTAVEFERSGLPDLPEDAEIRATPVATPESDSSTRERQLA